jgi:hypothetical protein
VSVASRLTLKEAYRADVVRIRLKRVPHGQPAPRAAGGAVRRLRSPVLTRRRPGHRLRPVGREPPVASEAVRACAPCVQFWSVGFTLPEFPEFESEGLYLPNDPAEFTPMAARVKRVYVAVVGHR